MRKHPAGGIGPFKKPKKMVSFMRKGCELKPTGSQHRLMNLGGKGGRGEGVTGLGRWGGGASFEVTGGVPILATNGVHWAEKKTPPTTTQKKKA